MGVPMSFLFSLFIFINKLRFRITRNTIMLEPLSLKGLSMRERDIREYYESIEIKNGIVAFVLRPDLPGTRCSCISKCISHCCSCLRRLEFELNDIMQFRHDFRFSREKVEEEVELSLL